MIKSILIFVTVVIAVALGAVVNRDSKFRADPFDVNGNLTTRQALEEQTNYWISSAQNFVQNQLNKKLNTNVAKNVIIFMGNGMSMTTLAATRPYIGGEERSLSFENFPSIGMAKTYCVDMQTADSACTGTAMLTGVKANAGTIGVTGSVVRNDCAAQNNIASHTSSIAKWAIDAGKVAGFVTTSAVTDASPACLYAHAGNKEWENDSKVRAANCDPETMHDIARQLVLGDTGSQFRVILGGGRQDFLNSTVVDDENQTGRRSDGRNLISEWYESKQSQRASYVWNKNDFEAVDIINTDYLLGLFESGDMKYHLDALAQKEYNNDPTLSDMTAKAIDILSKNQEGFFLFVEGGRINDAHHSGFARMALHETAELSKAVEVALNKLSTEDTLIIVTADHSQTMTYNGYPRRGNDVFGLADGSKWSLDGLPYMTLTYANGPGFKNHINATDGHRIDPRAIDTSGTRFEFPAVAPLDEQSNGGDDVAVYASGPWAHLFTGNYEQSVIPYMAAYASCIGSSEILKACD